MMSFSAPSPAPLQCGRTSACVPSWHLWCSHVPTDLLCNCPSHLQPVVTSHVGLASMCLPEPHATWARHNGKLRMLCKPHKQGSDWSCTRNAAMYATNAGTLPGEVKSSRKDSAPGSSFESYNLTWEFIFSYYTKPTGTVTATDKG